MNQTLLEIPEPKPESTTEDSPDLASGLLRSSNLRRQSVGAQLREAREKCGYGLEAVSDHLRIRLNYLQAIEDGRVTALPGATYANGFVRAYAEYLGLDVNDVVQRFRADAQKLNSQQSKLVFPTLASEARFPSGAVLFLSVLLAATVYGGWYYLSEQGTRVEEVATVPADLAAPETAVAAGGQGALEGAEAPAPGWVSAGPAPLEADATAAQAATGEGEIGVAQQQKPVAAEPTLFTPAGRALVVPIGKPAEIPLPRPPLDERPTPEDLAALGADEPATAQLAALELEVAAAAPAPPEPSRILLVARQESWVQVISPDSTTLMSQVMRAGESFAVPDRPGLSLVTGNAGGLEIWVDGRQIPPLGAIGVVRRGVPLDPARLGGAAAGQ